MLNCATTTLLSFIKKLSIRKDSAHFWSYLSIITFASFSISLAMTQTSNVSKTLYLIRHAESEENVRIQGLRNVGRSIRHFKFPSKKDMKLGTEGLHGFLSGHTDAELSSNGRKQVNRLSEVLSEANFLSKISKIGHSPLKRAKETCNGIVGNEHKDTEIIELDCLCELTPSEFVLQANKPGRARIRDLCDWLDKQRDDSIALVGHSQYFLLMLGMKEKLRNCDVCKVDYQGNGLFSNPEIMYRI